jgi:S1-C subfamily serine protease
MNRYPFRPWSALLACAAVAAAAAAVDPGAAPPPAAASRNAPADNNDDMEARLEAARRQLDQAVREVARLSTQLSGAVVEQVSPYLETNRAIIGVQVEPASGAAGARVSEVSPGGPAAEAGIRSGDVIVALNGTAVTGEDPVHRVVGILRAVKPESRVSVRVLRDGKPQEFVLTARRGPALFVTAHGIPDVALPDLPELRGGFMFQRPLMDMELATLTPGLGRYFGSDKGVLVVRAPADGALKLEDGDVILAIDGREPTSGSHATRILASYQPGDKVTLRVLRQHKPLQFQVTLPDASAPGRRQIMRAAPPPPPVPPHPREVVYGSGVA